MASRPTSPPNVSIAQAWETVGDDLALIAPDSPRSNKVVLVDPKGVLSDLDTWQNIDQLPSPVTTIIDAAPGAGKTVVLVDPLSTGSMLQDRLFEAGYRIILVWSDRTQEPTRRRHYVTRGHQEEDFAAVVVHDGVNLEDTLDRILAVTTDITAVMCGSEFGVLLEDAVANGLNRRLGKTHLKSSGMPEIPMKVDKHMQATAIRKAGLDAVRETLAHSDRDVTKFLEGNQGQDLKVVVKPQTGAGSVGVTFCESVEEVWDAYNMILEGEHKAKYGARYRQYKQELGSGVLLQEYLAGTEFIVNAVALDGVIKTTAMFKYDKRPYNTAAFVCFSKELIVPSDDPEYMEVLTYAEAVLEAIEFRNGAIHAEVMYVPNRGPVLVEVNCRLHGGNAAWVRPANVCMGYDQLSVMMDAYLNGGNGDFAMIPTRPGKALNRCHQVKMRSHLEGTLDCVIPSQLDRIMGLRSYSEHFFSVRPGDRLCKTIDMPTVPGEVTLIHEDRDVLASDYAALNEILREGIFKVMGES